MKKWNDVILFLSLFLTFFVTAVFADAGSDDRGVEDNRTFHVFDDVDLISTLKYDYGKSRVVIKSVYPQLASDTDREGITQFNDIAREMVKLQIAEFRDKVKSKADAQKNLDLKKITNNLYIDYNTSCIKSKRNHIISIRFSIQGFITGFDHSYHEYNVLNFDLENNRQLALSELFLPDSSYLIVLSEYAQKALSRRLTDTSMIAMGTAPTARNFANWNIKPGGLVITFNENQVAPAVFGAQTILVPYSALHDILSPDSPIADCVKSRIRCARQNLLTGGFIDEG